MKRITKLSILSLLVISFIGCEKNLESCVKIEFKKYANENIPDANLVSIEPVDTIFAENLIKKAYEALEYQSEVQHATDKLVRWMKSSEYSIAKMGYDDFMKMSEYIDTFIETKNMCNWSKNGLEESLNEAEGEDGHVVHYLLKAEINEGNIKEYHAYINKNGTTRIFDKCEDNLPFSVADWAGLAISTESYLRDANTQIKIAESLLRIANGYQ